MRSISVYHLRLYRRIIVIIIVATPGGCEAAVHAIRRYMATMSDDTVLVKLDFSNAFNSLHRDRLLKTVADRMPSLYRFCWLSYANTTSLQFRESTVLSAEGAHSKAIRWVHCSFARPFSHSCSHCPVNWWQHIYVDDVTLGGNKSTVADDINTIHRRAQLYIYDS